MGLFYFPDPVNLHCTHVEKSPEVCSRSPIKHAGLCPPWLSWRLEVRVATFAILCRKDKRKSTYKGLIHGWDCIVALILHLSLCPHACPDLMRGGVHFPHLWLWIWPCDLLWPMACGWNARGLIPHLFLLILLFLCQHRELNMLLGSRRRLRGRAELSPSSFSSQTQPGPARLQLLYRPVSLGMVCRRTGVNNIVHKWKPWLGNKSCGSACSRVSFSSLAPSDLCLSPRAKALLTNLPIKWQEVFH